MWSMSYMKCFIGNLAISYALLSSPCALKVKLSAPELGIVMLIDHLMQSFD